MISFKEYCKIIKEDWGKTSPIPKEVYDFPDPLKSVNWIDLGLPSGTLWADTNVTSLLDGSPYWNWDDIMSSAYKDFVPTKEQFIELFDMKNTDPYANENGYEIISKRNGNRLLLPAEGLRQMGVVKRAGDCFGYYQIAEPVDKNYARCWLFHRRYVNLDSVCGRNCGLSVRLVKSKE